MKLVTVAEITLNRPGSIGLGFQRTMRVDTDPRRMFTVVLDGEQPGDLRAKVQELAKAQGESESGVEGLTMVSPVGADGLISFNERGAQSSRYYADCRVFPALEIEGRFFFMKEVTLSP